MVVQWERWEGTIEHTLMAPVRRAAHLSGMCVFGVLHGIIRTSLIFLIALPFFSVDLGSADWSAVAAVLFVGSFPVAGLAVLAGVLPLLYPERGQQMSMMIQAFVLLVSGVYYQVEVLPEWLQVFSVISPATYMLDGIRGAIINGDSIADVMPELAALAIFGVVLIPASMLVFDIAERWAKKTGRLKRQG
jgi:ABC-2 type transport system permease protein